MATWAVLGRLAVNVASATEQTLVAAVPGATTYQISVIEIAGLTNGLWVVATQEIRLYHIPSGGGAAAAGHHFYTLDGTAISRPVNAQFGQGMVMATGDKLAVVPQSNIGWDHVTITVYGASF